MSSPSQSGVAIVAASTMRPSSRARHLQMRAADIEAGDDALSFFHASGFHAQWAGTVGQRGKSVAYHSCSRLERRRGGARPAGTARPLQADRHAAQRKFRCRRRRRGPAHALILSRPSTSPISTPSKAVTPNSGCACAAEGHAATRRSSGWTPASPMRRRLTAALAEPSLCPVLGSESQRDDALLGVFAIIPASSCRSISSATGFAVRSLSSTEPDLWPQQGDRHDAGQGRLRRRSRISRGSRRSRRRPETAP